MLTHSETLSRKIARNLPRDPTRPPQSCNSDPHDVLRTAPKGTYHWKPVLHAILRLHNGQHARRHKLVADKTTLDRERFYFKFWADLRGSTEYVRADPRFLKERHIFAVTQLWAERGLAVATVHNYLSFLRTYSDWIGRPGLVREPAYYFGDDSPYAARERSAKTDRSWSLRCEDVEGKLAEVAAYDPWVGLQLELCLRFGLRAKEARHFRPHEAIRTRAEADPRDTEHFPGVERFVRVHRGTKGGRQRDIPLRTPEQAELMERLLRIVPEDRFVAAPGRTAVQNANRFYNVMKRFGITKAGLGVTAHGLRHQYANDRYEELAGEASPVRGGQSQAENKSTVRLAIAHELGHGRTKVSAAYLGCTRVSRPAQAVRDEPIPEAATTDEA